MTRPSPPTQSGCSPPAGRRQHPICSPQPLQGPAPPSPARPAWGHPAQGRASRAAPASPVGRDSGSLRGPVFSHAAPGVSEQGGPGGSLPPAVLLCRSGGHAHPTPHRGLLSRQMRHFINCILNTCFKLVKALSSFQSLTFSPFTVAACLTAGSALLSPREGLSEDRTGVACEFRPRTQTHRFPGKETPGPGSPFRRARLSPPRASLPHQPPFHGVCLRERPGSFPGRSLISTISFKQGGRIPALGGLLVQGLETLI